MEDEHGFSLVEVVMAMFLLAVISLAVLPLLIGATRLSVTNKEVVAATAFANAQVSLLRNDFPITSTTTTSCAALRARQVTTLSPIIDPAGTGMSATIAVTEASCPSATADYPTTLGVTVTVRDTAGHSLAVIPTRMRVTAP